jgi:hypothetical protein
VHAPGAAPFGLAADLSRRGSSRGWKAS